MDIFFSPHHRCRTHYFYKNGLYANMLLDLL